MTNRTVWLLAGMVLLITALAPSSPAWADFELAHPDGRHVLLKDDGTWRYVEASNNDQTEKKTKQEGEAVLVLERKIDGDAGCRFVMSLVNNLTYEIRNIVPQFSAYRMDGVIYKTLSIGHSFNRLHPGDKQRRELQFPGIVCSDISRLQVSGGDRCDMGDLDRWSAGKGVCLERVRVELSDLVRFDK